MGCLQSVKQGFCVIFNKLAHCLQLWYSALWFLPTVVPTSSGRVGMSAEEEVAQRQKKELKEFLSKSAAMKKSAPVSDKKRRKEIATEIDRLEKEMLDRHRVELENVAAKVSGVDPVEGEDITTVLGNSCPTVSLDSATAGDADLLFEGSGNSVAGVKVPTELPEDLTRRQKEELKEFQAKASAMKKTAPVSDKKRRKEFLEEIERMEKELLDRHQSERENVSRGKVSEDQPFEEEDPSIANGSSHEAHLDSIAVGGVSSKSGGVEEEEYEDERADGGGGAGGPKLTRAQRRRVNKQAKVLQRLGELKVDESKPVQISARTAEKIKLKKILDDYSVKLVEVRSDGNCLYHSLVHQLFLNGTVISVPELREKTAHYMERHPDDFKPFLVHHDTGASFTADDFRQYLLDILNTNAWGSQVELRAISASLKWPIRVLQAEGTHVLIGEEYSDEERMPLTIVYHRHELSLGEHYNSVAPK
ncbi:putative OTU domain-containing protein 6B [Hypsibius exemplaris]|uniref:OTU domain-containing protein 6B n=1 Tax=Hypsibius exemplaris TaxID=2072580 RepID=A0A1W0WQG2_HYPEX|nr:putative OTU domain-containing protein 6B [Hypsibius exemplaris]